MMGFCKLASAQIVKVELFQTDSQEKDQAIGSIIATDTRYGLLLIPNLHDLPPGLHGFHLHAKPSCSHHGKSAGDHWDPLKTGVHLGPYTDKGHLGDLPVLMVNEKGIADVPVLAPRLKVKNLHGHALIIHSGGDNYADVPEKLGGGGQRIACGIVP